MGNRTHVPVVVIAGPTASAKSRAAIAVAREFGGVVINADSVQLYRDLRILSARPTAADEAKAPHRLFGVLGGEEIFSAAAWRARALAEIQSADRQGRLPVVVGGSGLYLGALMKGLAPVPAIPAVVRAGIRARYEALGDGAFRDDASRRVPGLAHEIATLDRQRLLRQMEVWESTGKRLVEWQQTDVKGPSVDGRPIGFAALIFDPPRADLYAACDRRFDAMMAEGALGEAAAVAGLPASAPLRKAAGMPFLIEHLVGNMDLAHAVLRAKAATRQYAKRQQTWLRTQFSVPARRFAAQYSESLDTEIFSFIRQFVLTLKG